MNNQYKDPEYHKKYYQAHKAEISAKRKASYKQGKYKAYKHNYYMAHREEILAKQKAKNAAKKAVQGALAIHQIPTEPLIVRSNVQEMHINDFFSKQLERIINVLWWICFAISFVGVAVLFK